MKPLRVADTLGLRFWRRSIIVDSIRLVPGDAIKIKDGTLLRVDAIDDSRGASQTVLRSTVFYLLSDTRLGAMLEGQANEVCAIEDIYPDRPDILYKDYNIQDVRPFNKVDLRMTNRLPITRGKMGLKEQRSDESSTYVCQWKHIVKYCTRSHQKISKSTEESMQRLRIDECTAGFGCTDREIRMQRRFEQQPRSTLRPVHATRYKFADYFCGSGMASRGAERAGLHVVVAFDHLDQAAASYRMNFPDAEVLAIDQHEFLMTAAEVYRNQIDVLHISFPCQYFSPAHTRPGKNDFANETATLTLLDHLRTVNPRIVTIEETSGLAECRKHRPNLQTIANHFTTAGYTWRKAVLNFADLGCPQLRRRLIFLAAR